MLGEWIGFLPAFMVYGQQKGDIFGAEYSRGRECDVGLCV